MIEPTFNSKRIAEPGAASDAFKTLVTPLTKTFDKKVNMNRKAYNAQVIAKQKADAKAEKEAAKEAAKSGKSTPAKTPSKTRAPKPVLTYKGKKPTAAAVTKQNAAAKTYVTRKPRGGTLTAAQSNQNAAAKTYMTKTSVPGQSGAAKGRPDTKASTKTAGPGVNKMAKATINKTGARNVRKSTKVTPVTKPPVIKPVNGAGRRANGAPKKRMR